MTDRVYHSPKPATNGGGAAPTSAAVNRYSNPAFPASKAQLYSATRPAYRQLSSSRRRHRRGCFCSCYMWTTLLVLLILLIAAIAGAVFYVLYRPQRPQFSVVSFHLSTFNLTDTSITSAFNITLLARNRNSKITFFYDQISVKVLAGHIDIGAGAFPALAHGTKNVTTLRTAISNSNTLIPVGTDISPLKSSVRSRKLPIEIQLATKVRAKMGKIKTKKLEIRVSCDGIRVSIPTGKKASVATTSKVKCKLDPRIKILRWTF